MARFGHSQSYQVLDEIAKVMPREVWNITATLLGPPIDGTAYALQSWLQGESFFGSAANVDSILSHIPLENLWQWVDEDIEKRAWYISSFAPKTLSGGPSITRELLVRYGDRDDVRSNLTATYQSEGWVGSSVAHYKQKKERFAELLKTETNENVRRWLSEYVDELDHLVERFTIEEERDDFHNPPV